MNAVSTRPRIYFARNQPVTVTTNLRESHWDDGEINLNWDQSTDDVHTQAVIKYNIHVNGVLSDVAVGRGRTIVYGNPGTNTITVTAVDAAGNESTPASITVVI